MKKKVIIVGAGPAGLFAAHKLADKADVTIIDKGRSIKNRKCSMDFKTKCTSCSPCNKVYGVGGAGLFSDGKLIFHTRTGNNLPELIGEEKTQELLDETEQIFAKYDIKAEKRKPKEESLIRKKAAQLGIEYIPSKQAHAGSDRLSKIMGKFVSNLKAKIISSTEVLDFENKTLICKDKKYPFDSLLFATGRGGLLEDIVDKHNIEKTYNPVDIGVRVEVLSDIMRDYFNTTWDFKARMITKTYQDPIRTFCVCPDGFVVREDHDEFCLVNGHSMKHQKSNNTNFAFLIHYKLKDPIKSGNVYGRAIAKKANIVWGEKPVVQRLDDLRRGRKSTKSRIEKYSEPKPTLTDVTYGDIGSGLEYRFVLDILEGLNKLDKLIPGVAQDSTLLYAPEIKFHGIRVETDKYLQSSVPGVYVAGDGAGFSRGIVGAAASGLLAAEGILR